MDLETKAVLPFKRITWKTPFLQEKKNTRFRLLTSFFISGLKISHRGSLREDSQQTGCFTPTDCLGLLRASFWVMQSTHRWNWNDRIFILVLILLFTSNMVPRAHLLLLKMGSCAGASAGNTFPLEGRGGRRGRCLSSSCLELLSVQGPGTAQAGDGHCCAPLPFRSERIWNWLSECLWQML